MSKLALIHQNNQSTFSVAGFFDLLDYAESDQFAARVDALQDGVFDIYICLVMKSYQNLL